MPNHVSGDRTTGDAVSSAVGGLDAASHRAAPASSDDAGALAAYERDQLASDIAEIERATAALRQAEPALESWTNTQAPAIGKPRPVWLLVGVLWLSTALVTLGAVVAIAVLVG